MTETPVPQPEVPIAPLGRETMSWEELAEHKNSEAPPLSEVMPVEQAPLEQLPENPSHSEQDGEAQQAEVLRELPGAEDTHDIEPSEVVLPQVSQEGVDPEVMLAAIDEASADTSEENLTLLSQAVHNQAQR